MNLSDSATLQGLLQGGAMLALFLLIFLAARWAKYASAGYDVHSELVDQDNVAVATTLAGYYLAVTLVFAGAYLGPSRGLLTDLTVVGGYTLLGIVLVNIARIINDKFLLHRFCVRTELLENRNLGVGVVLLGNYLAAGLVVAGAVHGEGGGPVTAIVFFLVGQLALVLFTWIYDLITPYSLHDELAAGNVAAGIGFSGALIAIGMIVMNAVSGDFVSWMSNGTDLAIQISVILIYLPLVRLFFDKVMLPGADLNREILEDRNIGAGILEFASAVGFSAVLIMVV